MKLKSLTALSLILLLGFSTQAQKVEEKDVLGTWKLVINIEDEMDKEADEAETLLEEVIINSVSGIVAGVLNNIEIYFEFQPRNNLLVTVRAFGDVEEEEGSWYINRKGYLVIEDLDDDEEKYYSISADDDEWKLIDGLLVCDEHEDDMTVYMARVD